MQIDGDSEFVKMFAPLDIIGYIRIFKGYYWILLDIMGYNWIYQLEGSKMLAPLDTIWILLDMSEIYCFKVTHKLFYVFNYLNRTLDRKCRTRNDCSGVVLVTDSLSWIRDS